MTLRNLVHFNQPSSNEARRQNNPLISLQNEVDKFFNDNFLPLRFTKNFEFLEPAIDISENDKEFKVRAELPGIDENDIDISVTDQYLTISGEKKSEEEEKGDNYISRESSYGSFKRTFALPDIVDYDKTEASFKRGVLTINIPKYTDGAKKAKKIKVSKKD